VNFNSILLADVNWVRIIIILIFVLGPLFAKFGKPAAPKQPQPQPQPPVIPPQNRLGEPRAPGSRDALESEIEEFLRKAGKKPMAGPSPQMTASQPTQAPRRLVDDDDFIDDPSAPTAPRMRSRETVGQHVREHIESHPVSEHARTLGSELGQADEKLENRLHSVFDHSLGQLSKTSIDQSTGGSGSEGQRDSQGESQGTDAAVWQHNAVAAREKKKAAIALRTTEIVEMLKSPAGMKQAIILSEILKRPEF